MFSPTNKAPVATATSRVMYILQVPDYYDVISKPMDFATMQNKLKNVEYSDPSKFQAAMLIVVNELCH